MISNYCTQPAVFEHYLFDTELVERVISSLTRGEAADIDGLTSVLDLIVHYLPFYFPYFLLLLCMSCVCQLLNKRIYDDDDE